MSEKEKDKQYINLHCSLRIIFTRQFQFLMHVQTSVSCFILSDKRFCPFLDPRVRELQEIVSKKSSFLYADCKEKQ